LIKFHAKNLDFHPIYYPWPLFPMQPAQYKTCENGLCSGKNRRIFSPETLYFLGSGGTIMKTSPERSGQLRSGEQ